MKSLVRWFLLVAVLPSLPGCFCGPAMSGKSMAAVDTATLTRPSTPLPRAHAHNDYAQPRPLLDALDNGFTSVEADVFLEDGELQVAHFGFQTCEGRTLRSLYLDPLRRRVLANGGRVHPDVATFTLLVDIKSDGEETYAALRTVLADYADLLTVFNKDGVEQKAATVIVSGDRPRAVIEAQAVRRVAVDGRPADLETDAPASLIPLVSDRWSSQFDWDGDGPMPEDERSKLRGLVDKAHAQGRRLRFWATPESEAVWTELVAAGVDHIGTDELGRLRTFLLRQQ